MPYEPLRDNAFVCLTEQPYQRFLGDEGCGFRWLQPPVPTQCPRCGNIYVRNETPSKPHAPQHAR